MPLNFVPTQALWGKQKGKRAYVPRWRRLEHGYGEVKQREQRLRSGGGGWWWGRRTTEDADVKRSGVERHDGRKYKKPLFGEKGQERTHERSSWGLFTRVYLHAHKGLTDRQNHQAGIPIWSPDPDGLRSPYIWGNVALHVDVTLPENMETQKHPSLKTLTTEFSRLFPWTSVTAFH